MNLGDPHVVHGRAQVLIGLAQSLKALPAEPPELQPRADLPFLLPFAEHLWTPDVWAPLLSKVAAGTALLRAASSLDSISSSCLGGKEASTSSIKERVFN